jgi:hypothetical protein
MEAAAADLAACARCGRQVPRHVLGYDGAANLVCPSCEADAEVATVAKKSFTQLIIGPPALALIGSFGICLPFINLFVPALFGVGAVAAGIAAVRAGISGSAAEGVTEGNKIFLILSGIVGGLWGLGLVGMNLVAWLGIAILN